jgi:RNA polymerase sigma-70 factor (ECF subfamily)
MKPGSPGWDGTRDTFRKVFDSCYEDLCRYAFTIVKDFDIAEDIVQSMFMKLWEMRESVDINTSVRSYLFRSVYNQCINHLEHKAVRTRYDKAAVLDASRIEQQPGVFPEELEENIRKAVDALPPQCRSIFIMSRYEELRYSEIADKLGISVNTIQNQVCKALKLLREALKDQLS